MATKTIAPDPQQDAKPLAVEGEEIGGERETIEEEIARRAYDIYLSGQGGSDLENWLCAEEELRRSV